MAVKPGWSKPSTILFASEIPANEKAFTFALAQATEFAADLILFHAYDTLVVAASETSGIRYYDYASAARAEIEHLEPLAAARACRRPPLRSGGAPRTGRRPDPRLHPRAGDRPDRHGYPLARAHRQVAGRIRGRGRASHRHGPRVHRRARGGRRHLPEFRNQHDSLRLSLLDTSYVVAQLRRRTRASAQRAP